MKKCEKCGRELFDDEICDCELEILEDKPLELPSKRIEKGRWKVILTAVLYPAIAMGVSAYVMTSSLGLIIAIIMNLLGAICIYIGGFTLIVLPLPFIYLYWVNCLNRDIKLWKRILLGIGAFALIFGSIVVAAAL